MGGDGLDVHIAGAFLLCLFPAGACVTVFDAEGSAAASLSGTGILVLDHAPVRDRQGKVQTPVLTAIH